MDPITQTVITVLVGAAAWWYGRREGYDIGYGDATRVFIVALQRNNETMIVDEEGICKIVKVGQTKSVIGNSDES